VIKTTLILILSLGQVLAFSFAQAPTPTPGRSSEQSGAGRLTELAARAAADRDDTLKPVFPEIVHPLPFKAGESLDYEISFEKLIFSGTIGDLRLSVNKADTPKVDTLALKAEIVSKGFFPTLFGIKVKDEFNAIVHKADFGLFGASRLLQEGKALTEHKTYVNRREKRVTYIFRDLVNKSAEPKVKEVESPVWVQDILSAIYFVRTQNLTQGKVIPIPITDAGQNYQIEVIVGEREEIKVDAGKFRTVKIETKAFNGKLVRKSGELFVWISDDERRLPVKAKIKVSGTTVNIELKKAQR
jgi:hypothetical protein